MDHLLKIEFFENQGERVEVIVGLGVLRFVTVGASDDPDLMKAVRAELSTSMGGAVGQALAQIDQVDENTAAKLFKMASADDIEIHSLKTSKSLSPSGKKNEIIVFIDYSLPSGEATQEYWKFEYYLIGGYRYKRETTALSYYLNF